MKLFGKQKKHTSLNKKFKVHTCGQHLELPRTYQSYGELAEEFTLLLRNKGAWGFNIV